MSNKVFGRLTALRRLPETESGRSVWLCRCSCGKLKLCMATLLATGRVLSCGCFSRKLASDRMKKIFTIHGMCGTPTYRSWGSMMARCYQQNATRYDCYGGRGISVCDRWKTFKFFFEDMGVRPLGMSLERMDNNGNYGPSNCRWATPKEQSTNRRTTRPITLDDKTLTAWDWEKICGIRGDTILKRINRGWSSKDAMTITVSRKKPLYHLRHARRSASTIAT